MSCNGGPLGFPTVFGHHYLLVSQALYTLGPLSFSLFLSCTHAASLWSHPVKQQSCILCRTCPGHDRGIACLQYHGDYIVSGSSDEKLKVWSVLKKLCLRTLQGNICCVRQPFLACQERWLCFCSTG